MEIVHATLLNTADPIRHRSKQRGDGRGTRDSLRHKEKGQICRLAQEHKCKQTTENYYEPYSRPFRSHGDKIIIKNISISKETIISCVTSVKISNLPLVTTALGSNTTGNCCVCRFYVFHQFLLDK